VVRWRETEYDILYAIPTDDYEKVLNHLNTYDQINNGLAQKMALIIDKTDNWEIQHNDNYFQTTSNILRYI
jgi:hypothetical protein